MMNSAFDQVIAADDETRRGLYATTAQRLGTTPQNVEKDFWVCWTLDALFNGLADRPRLLFKGGTSLSKGFGLIKRFSEVIAELETALKAPAEGAEESGGHEHG
ncbi:nucleotidyl transferase AbiEii/AbiGii toxin family protein [Halomonas sp. M1]|uniref:nucleotidyl transferase AbiEii/AbiGii toxin family protein n=1 Tax=Roseinatronobacter sp. S2 TaxID=3035471 RepID=UPI00240F6BB8|nr:nucleotidyl transferase AbiEii/AbiGii toxin family protein [Roseinatronobacter sp. S2]